MQANVIVTLHVFSPIGAVGVYGVAQSLLGKYMQVFYTRGIEKVALYSLSRGDYDPHHPSPYDLVHHLKDKITCPILLHVSEHDEILGSPDKHVVELYRQLQGPNTHIIVTTDASHNSSSEQHIQQASAFYRRYLSIEKQANTIAEALPSMQTQPTVNELREKVSYSFFQRCTSFVRTIKDWWTMYREG